MGPTPEKAKLGPPPRWLKCPRKGQIIANRFVPFKTPLCDLYDDYVPERYRFQPSMLFSNVRSAAKTRGLKVGLWIDLTNTDRFYGKEEVEAAGAIYKKLNCKGFGEAPPETAAKAFIELCSDHIEQSPNDLIAIHCTHGFNRTGFLIGAYLVTKMDWSVEAAVQQFAIARPPGIYKTEYLKELFKRYGDVDDAPLAPPLPDWCDESEPVLDEHEAEDKNAVANNSAPAVNGNLLAQEPQFEPPDVIPGVRAVMAISEIRRLQQKLKKLVETRKNGFPGSQPVSMDRDNIVKLTQKSYLVSWKADGTRYLMLIEDEGKVFMFDRDNQPFLIPNLRFPHRKETKDQPRHLKDTVVDGELVLDQAADSKALLPRFLIYDIIKFDGVEVGKCDLGKRFQCIDHEIINARAKATQEGRINKDIEPFSVRKKVFKDVRSGLAEFLSEEFAKSLPHEIDGLVFQPFPDPYVPGRCAEVLKWKPHEMNSVDFRLKIVRERPMEGMLPESVGYLYVLGLPQPFSKMKVTKELRAYDDKIIECKFNNGSWIFMRERKDKSFPNAFATATGVCNSIANPVTKDFLRQVVDSLRSSKSGPGHPHPQQQQPRHQQHSQNLPNQPPPAHQGSEQKEGAPPEKIPRHDGPTTNGDLGNNHAPHPISTITVTIAKNSTAKPLMPPPDMIPPPKG